MTPPARSIVSMGTPGAAILAHIHAEAFAGGEVWDEDAIRTLLETGGVEALVVLDEADPVGFILYRRILDEAEILTLAVRPEGRRAGAGHALVQSAAARLLDSGVGRAFLEVAVTNTAARALYERCRFLPCGTRRRYYADGGDALVLACDLRMTSR